MPVKTRAVRLFVTVSLCRSGNPEAVCFAVNFPQRHRANSLVAAQIQRPPTAANRSPKSDQMCHESHRQRLAHPNEIDFREKRQSVFLCGPMKLCVCGRWAGTPSQIRRARSCGKGGKIGRLRDFACLWSTPIASEYFPFSANRDPSKRTGNQISQDEGTVGTRH